MSIAKPFTFVANTYAKASEVNANFDTVYSQVNSNISEIAQNTTDIENLENNKADINGSSAQRFAVADAITNGDAINKQTLFKAIGNSVDYISGFIITKDSGSPKDTIIVSAGNCYDSTHTVVLSLTDSLSKQNTNQAASATYYVYIIGNSTGSSVDVLISESSVTPALPSGYSLYRQIGYYTTNSSNNIDNIVYYGEGINTDRSAGGTLNIIAPDWAHREWKSWNTQYSAPSYGWVWAMGHTTPGGEIQLTINSIGFIIGRSTKNETACGSGSMFFLNKGDTYKISGGLDVTGIYQLMFIPCKGVS